MSRPLRCLKCSGVARSISSGDIPSLLALVGRQIGIEVFMRDVEERGWEERCFYAPLSAVRICKGERFDT